MVARVDVSTWMNEWIDRQTAICMPKLPMLMQVQHNTKTYLYNFDPLKPPFYLVKLGFTGYALFFLFLLKNIDCGYLLECLCEAVLTSTHNLCFELVSTTSVRQF